jgi:hypothetical protein
LDALRPAVLDDLAPAPELARVAVAALLAAVLLDGVELLKPALPLEDMA